MDNGYATLRCTLKVHPRCDACKRHTMEILTSIVGSYEVTVDSERRRTTIVGEVDPNFCIRAMARCNGHAEVAWANISHPNMRRGTSYGYDDDDYYYGGSSSSYYLGETRRAIPQHSYYHRTPPPLIDYTPPYNTSHNYYYNTAAQDSTMNYCSIQ